MKKTPPKRRKPDMLPEYDFSKATRGRYVGRFPRIVKSVILDADVAEIFPDGKAANEALRRAAKTVEIDQDLIEQFGGDRAALRKAVNDLLRATLGLNKKDSAKKPASPTPAADDRPRRRPIFLPKKSSAHA